MSNRYAITQARGRSQEPKRVYNPEMNALTNLINQASNQLSNKSKSYAAKVKERQTSRKTTPRDYDFEDLETPKYQVPPEPAPMHPLQYDSIRDMPLRPKIDSESDQAGQDKLSTLSPSDTSFEKKSSIYTSVDHEHLLSIVRNQEPKAEFKSPGSHFLSVSSKNSSPERTEK